jgi:hypothetical protein
MMVLKKNFGEMKYLFHQLRKNTREADYRSGRAFTSHKKTCHKGDFDPSCPACLELQKKMEIS